jgi:DNA helicase II / ATP-dependent DNA helicase PcrA
MPWLLGKKKNGAGAGKQDRQRLLHAYVAMTRPSHLLALAVPRSALGGEQDIDETAAELMGRGWRIAELKGGLPVWRD